MEDPLDNQDNAQAYETYSHGRRADDGDALSCLDLHEINFNKDMEKENKIPYLQKNNECRERRSPAFRSTFSTPQ